MATISDLIRSNSVLSNQNRNSPYTQVNGFTDVPTKINTYIDQYSNDPGIVNQFKSLLNARDGILNDNRQNIINAYNTYEQAVNPSFRNYILENLSTGNQLLNDIERQKAAAMSYYGPGGEASQVIDDYTSRYGDLIARQASNNQALAVNNARRAGASQSAIRNAASQQQALDYGNVLKFQQQKVNDMTNLYNVYNNLLSGLRADASNAKANFIINPLQQIYQQNSSIAEALVNNEAALNNARLQLMQAGLLGGGGDSKNKKTGWTITPKEPTKVGNVPFAPVPSARDINILNYLMAGGSLSGLPKQ